jgi:hypothetical protein
MCVIVTEMKTVVNSYSFDRDTIAQEIDDLI